MARDGRGVVQSRACVRWKSARQPRCRVRGRTGPRSGALRRTSLPVPPVRSVESRRCAIEARRERPNTDRRAARKRPHRHARLPQAASLAPSAFGLLTFGGLRKFEVDTQACFARRPAAGIAAGAPAGLAIRAMGTAAPVPEAFSFAVFAD